MVRGPQFEKRWFTLYNCDNELSVSTKGVNLLNCMTDSCFLKKIRALLISLIYMVSEEYEYIRRQQ